MGRSFEKITPEIAQFIAEQPMFFVATAPSDGGHVNVSPKGLGSVKVLTQHEVAYLDLTGSGVETISHLRQNARITLMFCAFADKPNIVRVFGRGEAIPVHDDRAAPLLDHFPATPGARTVIRVDVDRVSTSCGYGVPILHYERDRDQLITWAERKGPDGLAEYWSTTNAASIDELPGLEASS
jgi:hypothetical protein